MNCSYFLLLFISFKLLQSISEKFKYLKLKFSFTWDEKDKLEVIIFDQDVTSKNEFKNICIKLYAMTFSF